MWDSRSALVTCPRAVLYCRHGPNTADLAPGKPDPCHVPKPQASLLILLSAVKSWVSASLHRVFQQARGKEGHRDIGPFLTQPVTFCRLSVALGSSYLFSYRPVLSLLAFVSVKAWRALFTLKGKTEIRGLCFSPGGIQLSATGSGPKCWFSELIPRCARC